MTNSEDRQMAIILSVEGVANAYLDSSMKKIKRSCNGDEDKAYRVMHCLSTFYSLRDDIKKVLSDSTLDF